MTVNVLYRTADLTNILDDATPSVVCVSAQSAQFVPPDESRAVVDLADVEAWAHDASIAPLAHSPPVAADAWTRTLAWFKTYLT